MNVTSIERNGNKTAITVEIEKDLMEKGAEKAYLKARKNIALPGFRKGKAPRKMIEKLYGAHVFYEDGLEEIFPEVYTEAVLGKEVKAIGQPSLTKMDIAADGTTTIVIETEVYPEVTLGQYKGLEVERPASVVTDEMVQAELDTMAKNVAAKQTVDGPAALGNTANIDFEGFLDGTPFEGGKGENYDLVLGSGSFIPGFEDQVVGMSAGEEKDLDVTFPANYGAADLAGKAVVFHVKVNSVSAEVLPAMDDEFAKDVSEFETLEELKADIRTKKLAEMEKNAQAAFENAAVEKAAENAAVDVPEALIAQNLDNQMNNFGYQLQGAGMTMEQYAKMMGGDLSTMRNMFRPGAEKQAKCDVVLEAIAEAEGLTISDEELEAEYAAMAAQYSMDVENVKKAVSADDLKADLRVRKAVKFVADNAVAVEPKTEE